MHKALYYSAIVLILTIFIFIMNAGDYMKSPRGQSDDVAEYIDLLREDIINEEWSEAEENSKKLHIAWKKVVPRIQFSVEKDEINAINVNLSRLTAYVAAREDEEALAELYEAREHWNNLNN